MAKTGSNEHTSDGNGNAEDYTFRDPQALAQNVARLMEESGRVLSSVANRSASQDGGPYSAASGASEAAKVLGQVAKQWVSDPAKLVNAQGKLLSSYADLWGRSVRRFLGEDVEPVVTAAPGDARFKDSDWNDRQYFDFWKQAYLLTANWVEDMVENVEGLDENTKRRAEFYVNQIASAMSPSNFVFTNPEVMRETMATNGENLVKGMQLLADDLSRSKDLLRISQTDHEAFEVGKNLAITPGKVVFQNDIFQLIQYAPSTDEAHKVPLLVIPPWINKFYILDLVPKKSFISWAVAQGFTVFIVSWVNPDEELSHKTFEDYMIDGVLEAVSAVEKATGESKVNALGYCVGGTLLASTLAYMAGQG